MKKKENKENTCNGCCCKTCLYNGTCCQRCDDCKKDYDKKKAVTGCMWYREEP